VFPYEFDCLDDEVEGYIQTAPIVHCTWLVTAKFAGDRQMLVEVGDRLGGLCLDFAALQEIFVSSRIYFIIKQSSRKDRQATAKTAKKDACWSAFVKHNAKFKPLSLNHQPFIKTRDMNCKFWTVVSE
jgi:hypothetical protein